MGIKKFKCGLCKEPNRIERTRKGLRQHLKKEHRILNKITNSKSPQSNKLLKQKWWIEEE